MQLITSPEEMSKISGASRQHGKSIGLVPTMGALHAGHLSLVQNCIINNDVTIVSIFVNPLQFNNSSDLENYPRTLETDLVELSKLDVDFVFAPSAAAMYRDKPMVKIDFGELERRMEGKFRSGHFEGVGIVVAKLFNLCNPTRAYFGLKDLQQYLLIHRMAHDLSYNIEVIGRPVIRETSGLAMSSRNRRLSAAGASIAANIYRGLTLAKEAWDAHKSPDETKTEVISFYRGISGFELEYFEIADPETLRELTENTSQPVAFCVAGYVEGIRLIDNLYLR